MSSLIDHPPYVFALSFLILSLSVWIGVSSRNWQRTLHDKVREDLGVMLAGTLTLLGFIGPLDPDCTAEKAAKGAAANATVGVGGRCSPAEAAKDSAKDAVGVNDKGPIEKKRDDDKPADKAKDAAKKVSK